MTQRTLEQARALAEQSGKTTTFDEIVGDETTAFAGSQAGSAHPCGCVEHTTVLSDGSFGWGGWTEECEKHFFEDR